MKQLLKKTTKGIFFALVLLLCLSIGMIAAKETAAMALAPMVTGTLTRVDQEKEQLFVNSDKGAGEVALTWTKESAFFLDNKAVSAELFINKATGRRVEIFYNTVGEDKKVISNARIIQ